MTADLLMVGAAAVGAALGAVVGIAGARLTWRITDRITEGRRREWVRAAEEWRDRYHEQLRALEGRDDD